MVDHFQESPAHPFALLGGCSFYSVYTRAEGRFQFFHFLFPFFLTSAYAVASSHPLVFQHVLDYVAGASVGGLVDFFYHFALTACGFFYALEMTVTLGLPFLQLL